MKRLTATIIIAFILVCLFAGCGKSGEGKKEDDSSRPAVTDEIFSTESVQLVEADGSSKYVIIHPENPTSGENLVSGQLFKQLKSKLKVSIKSVADGDGEDNSEKYEILVGRTDRKESTAVRNYICDNVGGHSGDYMVATVGKKIVIMGMTDRALQEAGEYFLANCAVSTPIEGGIKFVHATEGNFETRKINGESIAKFKIVRQHYNGSYLTQIEIEKLTEYIDKTCGYMLDVVEDAYVQESDYEIVIGDTNRPGSTKLASYDDVMVKIDGKKVYLNGGHSYSTASAVAEFTKLIAAGDINDGTSFNGSYAQLSASYDDKTTYKAVWYDDFDGYTIDTKNWRVFTGNESSSTGKNGKKSVRTNDPVFVGTADGSLYMRAGQDDQYYYGGMLCTDRTMTFKYGFLEFSQILPEGPGFWIAVWLSCNDPVFSDDIYQPEIDINEMFGNSKVVAANCHRWPTAIGQAVEAEHTSLDGATYGSLKKRYSLDGKNFNDDYHTFGCIHEPDYYAFTCDGEIYFKYDFQNDIDRDAFNHNTFIRLSMAVGFDNCSLDISNVTPDQWQNSNVFYTDHIYLYQMNNGIHTITIKTP